VEDEFSEVRNCKQLASMNGQGGAHNPAPYFPAHRLGGFRIGAPSGSVSYSLGGAPQLKPRRHNSGIRLDEREHTAIGGDEHIVVNDIFFPQQEQQQQQG